MGQQGFFHPSRGYWQAISDVPPHILDGYPKGTVEVPLKPGAGYDWDGNKWVYVTPPPHVPTREEQEANRQAAFQSEADPLFFKWQAGEGTETEWKAKREEIRARYPYPK
jgi:hypothetical protein